MNNVELTNDELALIATSLTITIAETEKYIALNGKEKLDALTLKTYEDMKILYKKLKTEYF